MYNLTRLIKNYLAKMHITYFYYRSMGENLHTGTQLHKFKKSNCGFLNHGVFSY